MKIVLLGNYSTYPFVEELGINAKTIKRVTIWNETLAEALALLPGIEVNVITQYKGLQTCHVRRGQLHAIYLSIQKIMNALSLFMYTFYRAKKFIKTINPDIVHGIGTEHIWPFVALNSGFPHVITLHGILTKILKQTNPPILTRQRYFALLERYVMKKAKNVIVINQYVQNIMQKCNNSARLYSVENPVHKRYFNVISSPSESKKILFVGHTGRGKGFKDLIEAFIYLKRKGVVSNWVISAVGPIHKGSYYDEISYLIRKEDIHSNIIFKGFLLPHEIIEEYKSSAFLVLPSEQETAPMSIAEAMACGLPVIATRVGGIPYMVKDNDTGLLFDVGKNEELADRMLKLIQNPDLSKRYGERSKVEAEKRWRPEKIAEQTMKVYTQIINEKNIKTSNYE
jgi:glycosyltransferase involved in cell wall biosynthesis